MAHLTNHRRHHALLVGALLIMCTLSPHANALEQYIEDTNRFPGWRGELPNSWHVEVEDSVGFKEKGKEIWRGKIEQLSWEPRAYLLHNFLSEEECDHLIQLGTPSLRKSSVVDSKTGGSFDSDVRTSSGTFLSRHQDDVVSAIEKRIAHVTMIPEENGESLQILKYVDGQKYEPHTDYFHDKVNADPAHGGQRLATVLMYLTTPEEGGETVFPHATPKVKGDQWSTCAKQGLAVKATRGNALLFYGMRPDGSLDVKSTHGSCPTTKGTKFSATKWIHAGRFSLGGAPLKSSSSNGCSDQNALCSEWAQKGECDSNPGYMNAYCKKSCGACPPKLNNKKISRKVIDA